MVGGGSPCYLFWAGEHKTCEWISLHAKVTAKCLFQTISSHEATLTLFSLSKYLWEVGHRLNLSHYTDKWNHWTLKWFMKYKLKVRKKKKRNLVSCLLSAFFIRAPSCSWTKYTFFMATGMHTRETVFCQRWNVKKTKGPFLIKPLTSGVQFSQYYVHVQTILWQKCQCQNFKEVNQYWASIKILPLCFQTLESLWRLLHIH